VDGFTGMLLNIYGSGATPHGNPHAVDTRLWAGKFDLGFNS